MIKKLILLQFLLLTYIVTKKRIVLTWVFCLLFQVCFPVASWALTSGPKSPEFSSFEPVATTNMVNLYSGDLTYNLPVLEIPGPDGGGYALSLSYRSGVSPEQEASWVGLGWTLNPGAINRTVRGLPDDYYDAEVLHYNKRRPNWTLATTNKLGGIEFFGKDASLSANRSVRINSYKGLSRSYGLGLDVKGLSVSMKIDHSGPTFSASVNPTKLFSSKEHDKAKQNASLERATKQSDEKDTQLAFEKMQQANVELFKGSLTSFGSTYGIKTFQDIAVSNTFSRYSGFALNISIEGRFNPSQAPVGADFGFVASFNSQSTEDVDTFQSFGYLYNQPTSKIGKTISDYQTEKSNEFSRRDIFLGIPFNTHDMFSLTGEGLQGAFRYFPDSIGTFHPGKGSSSITSFNGGLEGAIGTNVGIGLNFGVGDQTVSSQDWDGFSATPPQFQNNSSGLFKFIGDLGGQTVYSSSTSVEKAKLSTAINFKAVPGSAEINLPKRLKANKNHASSSVIEAKIKDKKLNGFKITNTDGNVYQYDQPVYSADEASLQFNVTSDPIGNIVYQPNPYENNAPKNDRYETILGDIKKEKYANTNLLSQITTPDYIDANQNAIPDNVDFGGWTRFHYYQKYAIDQTPYHWRTPYNGLSYQKNMISDTRDDLAGVSYGDKDVQYLKAIETKTHIAFFVTNKTQAARFTEFGIQANSPLAKYLEGSLKDRLDALGASRIQTDQDPASNNREEKDASQQMEYLEKIVLVSKLRMDQPIKITNFEYAYELCKGVPNNVKTTKQTFDPQSGKLTLKRVYFQYEGKFSTRISPYEFSYAYQDDNLFSQNALKLFAQHNLTASDFLLNGQYYANAQNPNYSTQILDAWGNVQYNAEKRNTNLQKWLYQGKLADPKTFDPAAWNLKMIKLPSGGEIHIGYEQKDYAYVQDRPAMGLVSLAESSNLDKNEFILNLQDIGVEGETDKEVLLAKIKDYYGVGSDKEKIYFKMLFGLKDSPYPSIDDCHSEYITGYAILESVYLDSTRNLHIKLKGEGASNDGLKLTPIDACHDFYYSNFNGKTASGCVLPEEEDVKNIKNPDGIKSIGSIVNLMGSIAERQLNVVEDITDAAAIGVCKTMNPKLSYVKIPLLHAKKGGGIRVKSLLLHNRGLEPGDESIMGSVFEYKTTEGKSSGVACNEPSEMREENPLVTFIPRKGQSWFDRITAGEDTEQTEGPVGENLLPSASVGYSRVKVYNIHSGRSNSGYTVHEFFTSKDYPFDKVYPEGSNRDFSGKAFAYSDLAENTIEKFFFLPLGIVSYSEEEVWSAQGFRFAIVDRSGVPKRNATYGLAANGLSDYLVSSEEFTYYEPGEKVAILHPDGTYSYDNLGKEMDLTMEMKSVATQTNDASIALDVSIGIAPTPPIFITLPLVMQLGYQSMSSHAISKVISYPNILRKVTNYKDGTFSHNENLAFDGLTGKPLVSKFIDEYNGVFTGNGQKDHAGVVYKTEIPAYFKYPSMGSKAQNNAYPNLLSSITAVFTTYGEEGNPLLPSNQWEIKNNVIAANIQTFATVDSAPEWNDSFVFNEYNAASNNNLWKNIWRPYETYVFKSDITPSNNPNDKVYSAGIITAFEPFNWANTSANSSRWIRSNTVTKYSPHGNALEERNVLGYYNTVKYGYKFTLPVLRAENAHYRSVFFDDFEDKTTSPDAHSGIAAWEISQSKSYRFNIVSDAQLIDQGAWLKFWVKTDAPNSTAQQLDVKLSGKSQNNIEVVGSSGWWTQYRVKIPGDQLKPINTDHLIEIKSTSGPLLIDDIRFQPFDSKMSCYVYDAKSFKLLAQFDDSHFGLFYQYNDEGKLVRKMIETEKGLKTITETQYHTPTINKQ